MINKKHFRSGHVGHMHNIYIIFTQIYFRKQQHENWKRHPPLDISYHQRISIHLLLLLLSLLLLLRLLLLSAIFFVHTSMFCFVFFFSLNLFCIRINSNATMFWFNFHVSSKLSHTKDLILRGNACVYTYAVFAAYIYIYICICEHRGTVNAQGD